MLGAEAIILADGYPRQIEPPLRASAHAQVQTAVRPLNSW
jgi:hypothetical protein